MKYNALYKHIREVNKNRYKALVNNLKSNKCKTCEMQDMWNAFKNLSLIYILNAQFTVSELNEKYFIFLQQCKSRDS
jgi:hypothetical protein